jgi:ABC-type transport system involved in cytochrome c biogenesis permease subunit
MMFVHPPLAIAGYVFVFLFTATLFLTRNGEKKATRPLGFAAWIFTLLGLVTGMVWAQIAWGSYWSWDPKETLTMLLFVSVSASFVLYYENTLKLAKWVSLISCVLSVITASSSFLTSGLHSFL